jgi:hypothetical protein
MDFINCPESKMLKLKIKIVTFRKLAVLPSSGEWRGRREEYLLCWERLPLSKEPNRVGVPPFSPSIHLRTEAEPASETL